MVYVKEFVVLDGVTVVHVPPPFVEYSHLITLAEFPLSVNVPLAEPAQTVVTAGAIVPPVGEGLTVIVDVAVFVHPLALVPVTVYVVVEVGPALTTEPDVDDNPVAGLQVYVDAPDAVKVILLPLQIVAEVGDTVTLGSGFTVTTVAADVVEHPLLFVTVTV